MSSHPIQPASEPPPPLVPREWHLRLDPLLLVATIWYIILTTVLSVGQYYIERHYARGSRKPAAGGLWTIARANLPLFRDLAGVS